MYESLKKILFLAKNKIVTRFILSHVFLVAASISLVGLFLLTAVNSFIRDSVNSSNLEKAKAASSEIVSFVDNSFNILSFATDFPDISNMERFRQELTLGKMLIAHDYYRNIFVVDTTGSFVASTELGSRLTEFSDENLNPAEYREGRYVSSVFIEENEPRITVTSPIYQFEQYVGFLAAEVSLNIIWDLVDSLSLDISGGLVYILNDEGIVIAHPDRRLVYGQENLGQLEFVEKLMRGEEGTGRYFDPQQNDEAIICAYTSVKDLNWGIVVAQSESIAFAVYREILKKLIIIIIGSIVTASLLAVVITQNLVRPLNSLVQSVKRVYEGNLPNRVAVPKTEELALLATEFNSMIDNLESVQKRLQDAERLATMSKFASVVAHEIRNPFNSIVINMQILKRGMARKESGEKLEQFMEIIDSEIRRIDGLIKNYLSLAKPPDYNPEPTDINVLVDELIILLHARAVKQSIRISREFDHESLEINVDKHQAKQAFMNVMLNAFHAMPKGGKLKVSIQVNHSSKKHPDAVMFSFSDTGIGIPPENLSKVFDYFFTSRQGGTGLGLAVTQQIVQGHNGDIEVKSQPGKGTTISIFLPA